LLTKWYKSKKNVTFFRSLLAIVKIYYIFQCNDFKKLNLRTLDFMFKLPAELTIAQVEECKAQFIGFIEEHDEIAFDDSDVIRVDTVGIQLLLSTVTYIAAQNKVLIWENKSTILAQSIKLLGIDEPVLNQYLNI